MPYIKTEARYDNTSMREIRNDKNVLTGYDIAPNDGYVLHNVAFDSYDYDHETGEKTDLISRGYSPSSSSVEPDYDWGVNPNELYAKLKTELSENEKIY